MFPLQGKMTPGLTKLHSKSPSLTVFTNQSLPTRKPLEQGPHTHRCCSNLSLPGWSHPKAVLFLALIPKLQIAGLAIQLQKMWPFALLKESVFHHLMMEAVFPYVIYFVFRFNQDCQRFFIFTARPPVFCSKPFNGLFQIMWPVFSFIFISLPFNNSTYCFLSTALAVLGSSAGFNALLNCLPGGSAKNWLF